MAGSTQRSANRFNGDVAQPTRPASALPSRTARLAAFAAVLVAGVCGGLIGWAVTDVSCGGDCDALAGTAGVLTAIGAAVGVAIVAVLTLRAMGEWKPRPPGRVDDDITR